MKFGKMKEGNNNRREYPAICDIPSTSELERTIIAEIITQPGCISIARDIVRKSMFLDEGNASLWATLLEMADKGEYIDINTLSARTDQGKLIEVFSAPVEASIMSITGHCEALRDIASRRSISAAAIRIVEAAACSATTIPELLTMAGKIGENSGFNERDMTSRKVGEVLNAVCQSIEEAEAATNSGKRAKIPTGFEFLDRLTFSGFGPGNLVILSARPSVGKTAVMLQMALTASRAMFPACVYSLEMTCEELAQRLMFSTEIVTPKQVAGGQVDWHEVERANAQFEKLPLYLNDTARTLDQIANDITLNNQRGRCSIAFIDYLGLIMSTDSRRPLYQVIAERTARLKQVAKQCGIPIVLLSQLNRNSAADGRAPELYDLRDSGSIEQDADIVLMLERETHDLNDHRVNMWVRKNRNGKAGDICVKLEANNTFTIFTERKQQ